MVDPLFIETFKRVVGSGEDFSFDLYGKYCVYVTTYLYRLEGLTDFYIGSTSMDKIKKGYYGSVRSKKWGWIWRELKDDVRVDVISRHSDREQALRFELEMQNGVDAVKNKRYFNESLASPNGFFGRDVSGENNPMYGVESPMKGVKIYGRTRSEESKRKTSETLKETYRKGGKELSEKRSKSMMGKNQKTYTDGKKVWVGRKAICQDLNQGIFLIKKKITNGEIWSI